MQLFPIRVISTHLAVLMAHAFIELNTEIHGRICERGLEVVLQHNRDNTIAMQADEIKDLKRKLEAQTKDTQWFKISRNHIIDEKEALENRLNDAEQIMRENFDAVQTSMRGENISESDWTTAYNSIDRVFDVVINRDDSESSSEAGSEAGRE